MQHAEAGVESNMRLTDFCQFGIMQSGPALAGAPNPIRSN